MKLTSDICNISLIYLALECSLDFELSVALYRGILNFLHLEGHFPGTPAQSEGKAKANSTFILFAQIHHLFVAHTKKIPHHTTDSTFRSTKSRTNPQSFPFSLPRHLKLFTGLTAPFQSTTNLPITRTCPNPLSSSSSQSSRSYKSHRAVTLPSRRERMSSWRPSGERMWKL